MELNNNTVCAVLCIDAVENNISSGRYYTGDQSREYTFSGLDRFLLEMDALMNNQDLGESCALLDGTIRRSGKVATFRLQILFRRNGSWQGSVMWLETRHEEHFRSALELLSIIDQALGSAQKQRMRPSSLKITKQ